MFVIRRNYGSPLCTCAYVRTSAHIKLNDFLIFESMIMMHTLATVISIEPSRVPFCQPLMFRWAYDPFCIYAIYRVRNNENVMATLLPNKNQLREYYLEVFAYFVIGAMICMYTCVQCTPLQRHLVISNSHAFDVRVMSVNVV